MAALLSLAACSRNSGTDEPTPQPNEPAPQPLSSPVGKWKYTGMKVLDGKNILNVLYSNPADDCAGKETFVFNTDGTAVRLPHRLSGSNCNIVTYNFTYSYNAQTKTLTLTNTQGPVTTHEVVRLDNNTFEYVYSFYDQDGDGTLDKQVFIYTRAN